MKRQYTPLERLLYLIVLITVPLLLVTGSVRLLATEQYLRLEYAKADFPADPYGFPDEMRLEHAADNLAFVRDDQPLSNLYSQLHNSISLYNPRELKHMQDVQNVYQAVVSVWRLALAAFVAGAFCLFLSQGGRPLLPLALGKGGQITAGLIVLIALLAVAAWQTWFTIFHQVFFAAGTWTFDPTDTLIRLFPERFWMDAAFTVSGIGLMLGIVLYLLGIRITWQKLETHTAHH